MDEVVTLLHSVPPWTRRTDRIDHRVDLAEIVAGWQEQFPGVEIERTMVEGDTVQECVEATGEDRTDGLMRSWRTTPPTVRWMSTAWSAAVARRGRFTRVMDRSRGAHSH